MDVIATGREPHILLLTWILGKLECVLQKLMSCEVNSTVCKQDPPLNPTAPLSLPGPTSFSCYLNMTCFESAGLKGPQQKATNAERQQLVLITQCAQYRT